MPLKNAQLSEHPAGSDSPIVHSGCLEVRQPPHGSVPVSSAAIAKVAQQKSRFEEQPDAEVHVGFAVHLLGIGPREVVRLCNAGALRARRNGKYGKWRLDKVFLVRWHDANPN